MIDSNAFQYCKNICEVSIPEGVEYISDYAFYECYTLKKVILPSTIKFIGANAFSYTDIEEIEVPKNAYLSPSAFDRNVKIKYV